MTNETTLLRKLLLGEESGMTYNDVALRFWAAKYGSCSCCTKTNEAKWHTESCTYRLICEAEEAVKAYVEQIVGSEVDDFI